MKTSSEEKGLAKRGETLPSTIRVQDEDFEPPTHVEAPIVPFLKIRQKPLVSDSGKTLQDPGGFASSVAEEEDAEELYLAVLDARVSRVYFEQLSDTEPICKSLDGEHGSRPREGDRFGDCRSCALSSFDVKPRCKEGRNILAFDLIRERPVVYTFTPSGLKPWRQYMSVVQDYAKQKGLARPDGLVPYIGHLLRTRVTVKHKKDPAPHFVPEFSINGELPEPLQAIMREARRDMRAEADRIMQQQRHSAEDYVGNSGGTE